MHWQLVASSPQSRLVSIPSDTPRTSRISYHPLTPHSPFPTLCVTDRTNVAIRNALLFLVFFGALFTGCNRQENSDPNRKLQLSLIAGIATPESVKALISAGADPSFTDAMGYCRLHWIASPFRNNATDPDNTKKVTDEEAYDLSKILIQAGAHVNQRSNKGITPVVLTAIASYPKTMQLLIDSGADINTPSKDNSTPLIQAVIYGDIECTVALISAGADVNAGQLGGKSVLELALQNRRFKNTKALNLIQEAAKSDKSQATTNDSP